MKTFLTALVLIVCLSSLVFAKGLKSVTCDPACGFSVKSHDESELVSIVQMHAKKHHDKDLSEADVKKMMKEEMTEKKEGMKE